MVFFQFVFEMDTRSKSRPHASRKMVIESDDEVDQNEIVDSEWLPSDEENNQFSTSENNNTSLPDDLEFDSTEGFNLKPVKSMKQSNHLIWERFGVLMKNTKIVYRDRIFCVNCFEKKKFKR